MLDVTREIKIDEEEIKFSFIRSSGPGGQNVNKVSSAVQLRFDVRNSASLPAAVKVRLEKLAGQRLTASGELVIEARRYRTQEQNRWDALQRFMALVRAAAAAPKLRKSTQPTLTAKAKRRAAKKHRAELKRWRSYIPEEWE